MPKIGLKLWSTNDFYIKPAMELYNQKVFDYIELYVVPGSAAQYLNEWRKLALPFILHAPHAGAGFNFSLESCSLENNRLIKEVNVFKEALNPKKIIFHPGVNGSLEETIRQIKFFKEEFPDFFKLVVIENKPKIGVNGESCMGSSPSEIRAILDETKLGFCFDMGHAICYAAWKRVEYENVVDEFIGFKPTMYHISDGDFHSHVDMHLNFRKGNFDLKKLIPKIPQHACVSIETDKPSKLDLNSFKEDVSYFRGCAYDGN